MKNRPRPIRGLKGFRNSIKVRGNPRQFSNVVYDIGPSTRVGKHFQGFLAGVVTPGSQILTLFQTKQQMSIILFRPGL